MDKLPHYCPICAFHEWNLDGLVEMIWEYLDLVRVYTKPKGKLPDFNDPVVLPRSRWVPGSVLQAWACDACSTIV